MSDSVRVPTYRRHKASGQAIVVIRGTMLYLGKYGSKASRAAYKRYLAEYLASGSVAVHQGLQGKGPLTLASGGDDGFLYFHSSRAFRCCARRPEPCKMPPLSQLRDGITL